MTEIPISPEIWKLAKLVCTERQCLVLELREKHGFSFNQLAINLNTVRSNVKEHHRAATRNILNAIDAAGGDVDLALANAQPRPTSETFGAEETPEEKRELDRIWSETRPASEDGFKLEREPKKDEDGFELERAT